MTDREKVVEELERLSEWLFHQYQVVYDGDAPNYYDAYKTVDDAISLLKEQEEQIKIKTENFNRLVAKIEVMPEVIRCKDCEYGAPTIINVVWLSVTCGGVDHKPGWFCADGERR